MPGIFTIINTGITVTVNMSACNNIITDVAEIVLNKCMEMTGRDKQSMHGSAVKFNYDYVDDFAEPANSAGIIYYNIHFSIVSIRIIIVCFMPMHVTRLSRMKMCPVMQHGSGQKDS
jgi:hypothetical protein